MISPAITATSTSTRTPVGAAGRRPSLEHVPARTAERLYDYARTHDRSCRARCAARRGTPAGRTSPVAPAISNERSRNLRIHTNGVLLSPAFRDLFAEYGIKVGISLDGDRAANDRHRRFADGRSSHAKVLAALHLLRRPEYRHLYAGLLCTIDVENDPVAVLDALLGLEPPRIDFLLPHATWDAPPLRPARRRRTVRPPLPNRQRLCQPLGLLRRPEQLITTVRDRIGPAAAAALCARIPFELPVPARGDSAHPPTLGRLLVGGRPG
ncbi:hypothetical protein [Kitasatospora sp. NPDC085879]|uniref:hypothetical protein n=1 Tax=Kitasatospora sp. NPDC085879 TaxID=3154769 RepID=UPI003445D600